MAETTRVLSGKLKFDEHKGVEIVPPDTVSYQMYDAETHSNAQSRWVVDSPGLGYLLDAFALVRFQITVYTTADGGAGAETAELRQMVTRYGEPGNPAAVHGEEAAGEQIEARYIRPNVGHGSTSRAKFALRQNFPFARAIQTATIGINGYQIVEQPYLYIDAMNRLKMSIWDSMDYATMSAGYFDSGDHSFNCKELQVMMPAVWGRIGARDYTAHTAWIYSPPVATGSYGWTGGYPTIDSAAAFPNANVANAIQNFGAAGLFEPDGGVRDYVCPSFNFEVNPESNNEGFARRMCKFIALYRNQSHNPARNTDFGEPSHARGNANEVKEDVTCYRIRTTLVCYEPIPVAPFAFYPSEGLNKTIPNIDRLTVQYNYVARIKEAISTGLGRVAGPWPGAGVALGGVGENNVYIDFSEKPQLRLRWFRPPVAVPPAISLNLRRFRYFQKQATGITAGANAATQTVDYVDYGGVGKIVMSFPNIRLDAVPDMWLIFFKYNPNLAEYTDPSDHNLAIESMQIEVDGQSTAINANSADLYKIWLSNSPHGCKSSFDQWFKRHCVCAIRPDDLGIDLPLRKPVTMHLRNVTAFDFWFHPRTGREAISVERGSRRTRNMQNYHLHVIAVYDQRQLVISTHMAQERAG